MSKETSGGEGGGPAVPGKPRSKLFACLNRNVEPEESADRPKPPSPKKKLSHPGFCSRQHLELPVSPIVGPEAERRASSSSPCQKKLSLPNSALRIPVLSLNSSHATDLGPGGADVEADEEDVTESLASAVRKMSRGSSPISPKWFKRPGWAFCTDSGLQGLARGYEQYKESLNTLKPATEFAEPSSDDLSSEWDDSCAEEQAAPSCPGESDRPLPAGLTADSKRTRRWRCGLLSTDSADEATVYGPRKDLNDDEEDPKSGGLRDKGDGKKSSKRPSAWRKVRNMVQWTPFVQTFKNRKYQWVQLAGHSGNFKAGKSQGTVLKKLCPQEEKCYGQFSGDTIANFVPEYQGKIVLDDDEKFIQLQDCLSSFEMPSIMDCKIGVRTYLEEELEKAKEKPKLRKDMYEKMIAVDPAAPTAEEHRLKGVTKPRYMVWRETISSTATLGFRLEGVKKNDGTSSKDFKTTKSKDQVLDAFLNFISSSVDTAKQYLERLVAIRNALEQSTFFKGHELIGSSLLFVHDTSKACIWLIDFGKTVALPNGLKIDHKSPWEVGNHEDGYLIGIENIISIFTEVVSILDNK